MRRSADIRNRLQQLNEEIQQKQQMKISDTDLIKTLLERCVHDLRAIQAESTILDRLMEESNTTITDSTTNRNIFFLVESRTIQNLVETIENKVYLLIFNIK